MEPVFATDCVEEQVSDLENEKEWLKKVSYVQNEVKLIRSSIFGQNRPRTTEKRPGRRIFLFGSDFFLRFCIQGTKIHQIKL